MEAAKFETNGNIWEITISSRGKYDTKATPHKTGDKVIGLIRTYGMNLIPDNDTDMVKEIGKNYAEMLNRTGISGAEYDGAEIHCYNGEYGYRQFAEAVYSNLDHPVVAHDSGGVVPLCHFEYRFNSVRRQYFGGNKIVGGCGGEGVMSLVLSHIGRDATIPTEFEFYMNEGMLKNVQRFGIQKSEPMFGVSVNMLNTYGLSNECLSTLSKWKKIIDNIDQKTKDMIAKAYTAPTCRFTQQGFATETVFCGAVNGEKISLIPRACS